MDFRGGGQTTLIVKKLPHSLLPLMNRLKVRRRRRRKIEEEESKTSVKTTLKRDLSPYPITQFSYRLGAL